MTTVGEALVHSLKARGVDTVFGIPGVHTIELYRGLAGSGIRHVTPRHEQGAGFMADGYARATGKPGVAFVITGPGLTNILTPMAQARADSIPMLVISGVNRRESLGKGFGCLHELPDQLALARTVALHSETVEEPMQLEPALDRAFAALTSGRPGPVHIEVPTDVMPMEHALVPVASPKEPNPLPDLTTAAPRLAAARHPVILAGGGATRMDAPLTQLAERLGAPVVQTTNARGLMHGHPLAVPASPSLAAVRRLIESADLVLALGTELGPTDYDMYALGGLPDFPPMIRIDCCAEQLARHPVKLALEGRVEMLLPKLVEALPAGTPSASGKQRAAETRAAAMAGLGDLAAPYPGLVEMLITLRDRLPGAIIAGDSTQMIYAANLAYDHDRPGGWFNGSTGFGALGYAIPAAIGAAIGTPDTPVIALAGDGGAQFTQPEMMAAVEERLPVLFVIWNNSAFLEIGNAMRDVGIEVVGCDPVAPDYRCIAAACSMPHASAAPSPEAIAAALDKLLPLDGPKLLEIDARRGGAA
ncbi:5-guanidino-2-oxopentanoate decarboxylase [Tropicimonas sp. TH_r6]|uniref:5-guanidino-2-oxopentanoate decarboxylase n=1 Tax=Tropicimonas sp. TH_r6 TaxID=3082085 RepID=UPI0029557D0E|nr:5-guanidino-2-oxopentanoate decarboxylase [Tropicimonas sp. TH_r6]MDV7141396.1 5-guanidino-2-oxopentanoate decarboxylase [Tropicimonas sp. TH_r6]